MTLLVGLVDLFPFDVKHAQLMHVIDQLVAYLHSFMRLTQSVLVSMNLAQDCAVLQFQLSNYEDLAHAV